MGPVIDDLTVLIPVRDDRRLLGAIGSMEVECAVMVVLNGATPAFEAWVRERVPPRTRVLSLPEPGLGRAYNEGLRACDTEYALLMDSDCRFAPGTIERLRRGLAHAPLSKGRVAFEAADCWSRVVAQYREFHTSDFVNAYSPPLALSRTLVEVLLGGFFREELAWSEDFEFDRRVRQRGLRIHHDPEAVIFHPPLGLRADLRAAYNYGRGYAMGERLGVLPRAQRGPVERLRRRWRHFDDVWRAKSLPAGLYALVWNEVLRAGRDAEARR